jgi:hypothetical protein
MRKLGLFIVLAAVGLVLAAATVAAAPATSSASAANFRIHETIVAALIPSELVAERDGVPVETSVPHIGRATMLYGETLFSDHGEGSNGTVITWIWSVGVSFATDTGDQLTLGAVVTAHVPPDPMPAESEVGNRQGTWTASGTGRFADYSGSGTFKEVSTPTAGPCDTSGLLQCVSVDIVFEGTLHPHPPS